MDIGRMELRHTEDGFWTATYRMPNGEAYEVGRIRYSLIENNERRREAFKDIATESVGEIVHDVTGKHPTWTERTAG